MFVFIFKHLWFVGLSWAVLTCQVWLLCFRRSGGGDVGVGAAPCRWSAAVHLLTVQQVAEVHVWRPRAGLSGRWDWRRDGFKMSCLNILFTFSFVLSWIYLSLFMFSLRWGELRLPVLLQAVVCGGTELPLLRDRNNTDTEVKVELKLQFISYICRKSDIMFTSFR